MLELFLSCSRLSASFASCKINSLQRSFFTLLTFCCSLKSSMDDNQRAKRCLKAIRIAFIAAIVLIVLSGGLSGTSSNATTSRRLAQAGYIVLTAVLAFTTLELLYLSTQKHRISPNGFIVSVYAIRLGFYINDKYSTWNLDCSASWRWVSELFMDFFTSFLYRIPLPFGTHYLDRLLHSL